MSFHNKDPPNDIYCITEKPSKHYFTEKFHTLVNDANDGIISTPRIKMAGIRILLFFVFSSKRASSICPTINQVFQKLSVLCLNFLFFHIISRLFSVHCDVMNHCLSTLSINNTIYNFLTLFINWTSNELIHKRFDSCPIIP